jgi:hypothetical protein
MTHPDQAVPRQDMQRTIQLIAERGGAERFKAAVPEEARKTIDDGVDGWVDEFRRSNPDPDLTADVRHSIQHLAYYYAYRGDGGADALQKAANGIINAKYDFSGTLRVPKGYRGIVEGAGDALQHHIKPEDLVENIPTVPGVSPEKARANMLDSIHGGFWQTNPRDDGALLYLRTRDGAIVEARLKPEPGQQVGPQIEFKWTDARRLSQFAPPVAAPTGLGPEWSWTAPAETDRGFAPLGYRALMLGGPPT